MCPQDEPDKLKPRETTPDGVLQRFEAQLASLAPRAARLDRDRLMFLAGQASAATGTIEPLRRGWAWPAAFSAMTALAAALRVMVLTHPEPRVIEKIVRVPVEVVESNEAVSAIKPSGGSLAPSNMAQPLAVAAADVRTLDDKTRSGHAYVELRDRVLAMGLDTWTNDRSTTDHHGGKSPAAYHELLDSLLHGG